MYAENTGVIRDEPGKTPDIVVNAPPYHPICLEIKTGHPRNVDAQAKGRVGKRLERDGRRIESAIAVVLSDEVNKNSQRNLTETKLELAVYTLDVEDTLERWPSEGYIAGDINFLADVIEHTSLSARRLWEGTNLLEQTVRQSAGLLTGDRNEYVRRELGNVLRQEPGEQTTRMTMAILANAVIFHKRLARLRPDEVPDIVTCKTGLDIYLKSRVLASWRQILRINYWPIFALAHDLLEILPDSETNVIVARLEDMASSLQNFGAIDVHDLSGRMFQQLIADREFLATYYTLPASAMLLGELAISRLRVDWNDHSQISRLRVGDFACGTGALLGAACHAISSRYRRASGYDGGGHGRNGHHACGGALDGGHALGHAPRKRL